MIPAVEFLQLEKTWRTRARRIRLEDDTRLTEHTGFDLRLPWVRVTSDGQVGYGRVHPLQPALMEFVPNDGEARLIPVSRGVAGKTARHSISRGFKDRNSSKARGEAVAVPPPQQDGPNDWWTAVEPNGQLRHLRAPARWVKEQTALRDIDAERHAERLAAKRGRMESTE